MRSAEIAPGRLEDRRRSRVGPGVTGPRTPKSFGTRPAAYLPHPPLVSGGWYHRMSDRELAGPGRYPVAAADDKTVGAALFWTFFFGPLGLCYLSAVAGIIATALTVALLLVTGSALVLAILWPLVIVLSVSRAR